MQLASTHRICSHVTSVPNGSQSDRPSPNGNCNSCHWIQANDTGPLYFVGQTISQKRFRVRIQMSAGVSGFQSMSIRLTYVVAASSMRNLGQHRAMGSHPFLNAANREKRNGRTSCAPSSAGFLADSTIARHALRHCTPASRAAANSSVEIPFSTSASDIWSFSPVPTPSPSQSSWPAPNFSRRKFLSRRPWHGPKPLGRPRCRTSSGPRCRGCASTGGGASAEPRSRPSSPSLARILSRGGKLLVSYRSRFGRFGFLFFRRVSLSFCRRFSSHG